MRMPLRTTLRLVPVAGGVWITAFAATHVPDSAPLMAVVLWLVALGGLGAAAAETRRATGSRRAARLALAVLALTLAASAAAASHVALAQPDRTSAAAVATAGGRALTVSATVTGKIERRGDLLAFDAVATHISAGERGRTVQLPIVIEVAPEEVDDVRALDMGATVHAHGTARPGYPGDRAVVRITASRGVDVARPPAGILAATSTLRSGLVDAVAGLPPPGAGLIPGLSVGDTSVVGDELDSAMKASSLSHLTAVSGANCALVVGLAFGGAALAGASRRARVAAGMGALVGFVLLVTPEPSVVRAASMAAIAMLGVLLGRAAAGMAILSLAVSVLLVVDPWLAGSLGFALSSAATASLLLAARPLAAGLARRMPRALALALSVPLAAQLACGPLLLLITPTVPLYGVAANLLAAPAAPIATVAGLAACLAAPWPAMRDGLAALAWLPASWIAGTAHTIVAIPGDTMPWLEGWPGVVALTLVGTAIGVLVALAPGTRATRSLRLVAAIVVSTVIGVAGGTAALSSVAGRWTVPSDWSLVACDVGQGDAVLLRSAGVVALVDAGPAPEALDACLSRAGVAHVDLLVVTHFDLDHVGGVLALDGRVGTVLHGPADAAGARLLDRLAAAGSRVVAAHAGMSGSLGDARWRVVWPRPDSRAFPIGNDASIVLDVRGGGIPPTLLLGDLSASPQQALAASGSLAPPYAIVKVAHHGSADQDAALYRFAAPALALVTVGADNHYGHPRAEILATLGELGAAIARTDAEGMIVVATTRAGLTVWRERDDRVSTGG